MNIGIQLKAKAIGVAELQKRTGLSRSHIDSILKGKVDPQISTLRKILQALGYDIEFYKISEISTTTEQRRLQFDTNFLKWSMATHGAPLMVEEKSDYKKVSLEKVLLASLLKGREDATIHSVLPIFLFLNKSEIDFVKLAHKTSEKSYLGYLLNLAFQATNDLSILELFRPLMRYKKKSEYLIRQNKISRYSVNVMSETDNPVAVAWGFITSEALSDILVRFRKWQNGRF